MLMKEGQLGNHGSWAHRENGAGQVYSQSSRPVITWWCFWKPIITSQAKRTVKALELEFPASKIRTAVEPSLWALHMTMPDQSGL